MSRVVGLVAMTAVSLLAIPPASARPVRLQHGGTCDLHGLDARVARLTGNDPFDDKASASIAIRTRDEAGRVIAEIRTDDGHGHTTGPRVVSAGNCRELLEATATIVAMALAAIPAPSAPVVAADDAEDPIAQPRPVRDVALRESAPASSSSSSVDQFAVLVGGAGTTSLDHTMAQAMAGIRWRRGSRSLTVEAHLDTPESFDAGAGHIGVMRTEATLSPCLHVAGFGGCALASFGTIRGESSGLFGSRSAYTPLVAFGGRTTWEHAVSEHWSLRVHLDVSALATRTRFDVDNMAVWSSQRVEGSAGIGVLAQFP